MHSTNLLTYLLTFLLGTAVILAGTAAAGGEGGAEEQHVEDAAAATADEDADNSNTNAGDKPSSTSGKSQLATCRESGVRYSPHH